MSTFVYNALCFKNGNAALTFSIGNEVNALVVPSRDMLWQAGQSSKIEDGICVRIILQRSRSIPRTALVGISVDKPLPRLLGVVPGERYDRHPVLDGVDRGATEDQLAKVAGENTLRVWRGVERVRDEMKAEGVLPVEDVWEDRTWWRYNGDYQMPDPDPEDKLGLDWYGVPPPDEGLYLEDKET